MKYIKYRLIIALFFFAVTNAFAQETLPASGGDAAGLGGSSSYSVGQIVYSTNSGNNGSVAQGIQQAFEISVVTESEKVKGISLNCIVYPNPTNSFMILKVENISLENLSYQLYDVNGKLLENKRIESSETKIVTEWLMPSAYLLKIKQTGTEIKVFNIIKN